MTNERFVSNSIRISFQRKGAVMTDTQRRAAIFQAIEEETKVMTATKKKARDTLIGEGIYDEDGELSEEFRNADNREHANA
jgi:hypothetical protein